MKSSKEIEQLIQQITEIILDIAPEARVEQKSVVYESEDANLQVYPPLSWDEAHCLELQSIITSHTVDIHLDTGFAIAAYVFTPEQQIEDAQQRLIQAQRVLDEAERILAEASSLGLLNGVSAHSKAVLA